MRNALAGLPDAGYGAFAYPYGEYDEPTGRALLESGFRLGFTCEPRRWQPSDKVMTIPRFEVTAELDLDGFTQMLAGSP